MNAREDQIRKYYDLDLYDLAKTRQIGWVVTQSQISYITPAQIMEKVQISTQLILFTPKSLLVEFRMMDEHRSRLKSMMWTKFVHVDLKTQKSKVHSDDLLHLFEQAYAPIDQSEFSERLVFMASSVKANE
jgi:acyl-CoA thioester hydrolase